MNRALALVIAVATCALAVCSLVATNAAAATVPLAIVVDDRAAGTVQAQREGATLAIPLLPVAVALGWGLDRSDGGWRLRGEGHAFILRAGSVNVTERGGVALVLHRAPVELERRLFVATDDVAALFDIRAGVVGRRFALSTTTIDASVAVSEQKKPAPKKIAPTPSPSPTPAALAFIGADRVSLTLVQHGPTRSVGLALQTAGTIRSGLSVSDDGSPATGSVTLGTPEHNLTAGTATDPLVGAVFRDPGLTGVGVRAGRYDLVAGRRARDGRTVTALMAGHGSHTDLVEVLRSPGGAFDQVVFGRRVDHLTSWGLLREELFVGSKGFGAGAYARTSGRFYGELTVTEASSGLPLQTGDAPLIGDGAYDLSKALTARLGFSGGHGTPSSPFAGLVVHGAHLGGSVTVARGYAGLSGSYAAAAANAQFSISRSAGATSYGLRSAGAVRGLAVELTADSDDQGNRNVSLLARRVGRGVDLLAGAEAGRLGGTSWVSPVIGLAAPVVRGIDIEATMSPQGSSRPAFKLSLVAGFTPSHRAARLVTVPLTVRVDAPRPQAVVVYVDGFRTKQTDGTDARIDVAPGSHFVRIESLDGNLGSPDTPIDTGATREAQLPLWPMRAITGHIAVEAPASLLPRDLTLAGVVLVLEPGGVTTTADTQGAFAFPVTAIAPNTVVRIDEDTAPLGLAPVSTVAPPETGDVVLTLGPARKIERVTFPSH